ncbi:MAG: hypothetical protein ACRDGO_05715 [Actinomycetota bacterium]
MSRSGIPAWLVGVAGLLIGVAIALPTLIKHEMDPTIFVALGEGSTVETEYAVRLLGDVTTRQGLGHDGRFFFAQANDPWYIEPEVHAAVLDEPRYRAQRMLYPLVAGGFGFFPPDVVAWSMLVTNLLALGLGAYLAALLAVRWGGAALLGLAVPLNIGLIFELDIGGAGILAYACCLGAVSALVTERVGLASLLFAAAALSREVMVLFAIGVVVLWWLEERRFVWQIVVVPVLATAGWYVYLWYRLMGISGVGGRTENFAAPFVGIVESFRSWLMDPIDLLVNLVLLSIVVALVPLTLRSRLPLAWGALPFIALATVLSVEVLREPFNLSRALAPVFTAIPFLIFGPKRVATDADPLGGAP